MPLEQMKKEHRKFLIAGTILLLLFTLYLYWNPIAEEYASTQYIMAPKLLIEFGLLPILFLLLAWVFMQGLFFLGLIQKGTSKYRKALHILSWAVVLLYALVIIPFLIENIYVWTISFHSDGFSYSGQLPPIIYNILFKLACMDLHPSLFILPGILFWSTGRENPPKEPRPE